MLHGITGKFFLGTGLLTDFRTGTVFFRHDQYRKLMMMTNLRYCFLQMLIGTIDQSPGPTFLAVLGWYMHIYQYLGVRFPEGRKGQGQQVVE